MGDFSCDPIGDRVEQTNRQSSSLRLVLRHPHQLFVGQSFFELFGDSKVESPLGHRLLYRRRVFDNAGAESNTSGGASRTESAADKTTDRRRDRRGGTLTKNNSEQIW